jgi:predicted acyltransferase
MTMVGKRERRPSIDAFRGLAIVLMVAANFLAGVTVVPGWLRHAPDIGLTVIDVIAPMFITAIGLTYASSARSRRERSGTRETVMHLLRRYLAIAGIGALLAAGEGIFMPGGAAHPWGVLQAIGFAGVLLLPLAFAPSWARLVAGLGLLAGYQLMLDRAWLGVVLTSSHGGLPGTLGWAGMLSLATVVGDVFSVADGRRAARILVPLAILAAGVGLALLTPVSKNRVSSSYVLVSLGICSVLFLGFHALFDLGGVRIPHLEAWGANPLLLYLLHELLLGVFVLPGVPALYAEAPVWLAAVELLALLGVLGAVAEALRRRGAVYSV